MKRMSAARLRNRKGKTPKKEAVFSLVERGGAVRSFHVPNVTATTLRQIIVTVADRKSHFRTDHSPVYWTVGDEFKRTIQSTIRLRNTCGATLTPTPPKAISASSSA